MKKTIVLAVLLLAAVVASYAVIANQKKVSKNVPAVVKTQTTDNTVSNQGEVIYKNINLGFQITMPKEWSEYLAIYECGQVPAEEGCMVRFLLPTKDTNWWGNFDMNDKHYAEVFSILAMDPSDWDNIAKSNQCEQGPCLAGLYQVIGRNNTNVYGVGHGQDLPRDLEWAWKQIISCSNDGCDNIGADFKNGFKMLNEQ